MVCMNPCSSLWIPPGYLTALEKSWWRYFGSLWSTDRLRHTVPTERLSTGLMTFLRLRTWLREACNYADVQDVWPLFLQHILPFLKSGMLPFPLSPPPKDVLIPHFRLQPLCQSSSGSSLQEHYLHKQLLLLQNRPLDLPVVLWIALLKMLCMYTLYIERKA